MTVKSFFSTSLFVAASYASAGNLVLVETGMSQVRSIAISPLAGESEQYAAKELSCYIGKSTGVILPIGTGEKDAIVVIKIDPTKADDAFHLNVNGGRLLISGGKRGVLYGVYEVLERFGGIGWFSSWCEVVPKRKIFAVPDNLDEKHAPALKSREAFWYDAYIRGRGDFAARLRLNGPSHPVVGRHGGKAMRFGGGLGSCHTFGKLIPPKVHFATHPEWFAEVKGKRRASGQWQPCLTNPGALALVTSNVLAAVKRDPSAQCYGVSQNDCYGFCECVKCKAVDDEEGSHSGTMIRFVNSVADAVKESYPDKIVETLAYHYTQKPPRLTCPRDNVMPYLCSIECDFAQSLASGMHPKNVQFREDIVGWAKISRQLYVWDYAADFNNYLIPYPVEAVLQENIRFLVENRVIGVFEQGDYHGYHGDLAELKTYLAAKLEWDPNADVRELERRFTDGFYGEAAAHVREYLALRRRLVVNERSGDWKFGIWASPLHPIYTDEFVAESIRIWRRAAEVVKDDVTCAYNVRMGAMSTYCLKALRDGKRVNLSRAMSGKEAAQNAACAREVLAAMKAAATAKRPVVFAENLDARNTARRKLECVSALGRNASKDAFVAAPERVMAEESVLKFTCEGRFVAFVDDSEAMDGRAVKMERSDNGGWHTHLSMSDVAFDRGVAYRLRLRVRAAKTGAGGKGFSAGVYDFAKKKGVKSRYINLSDMENGYAWYDILEWTPESTQYIWIAPGQFDRKSHDVHPGHDGVFVDSIEFVRLCSDPS